MSDPDGGLPVPVRLAGNFWYKKEGKSSGRGVGPWPILTSMGELVEFGPGRHLRGALGGRGKEVPGCVSSCVYGASLRFGACV